MTTSNTELAALRAKLSEIEAIFDEIEAHRDQHQAAATRGLNAFNEADDILERLADAAELRRPRPASPRKQPKV